jgi:hypothetical protein
LYHIDTAKILRGLFPIRSTPSVFSPINSYLLNH